MSSLLSWTKRRPSRSHEALHSGHNADNEKTIAKKVIQATSPDHEVPSPEQLSDIVRHIASRETAETEAAVRALKSRLEDQRQRPRILLNTLALADHLLRTLTEARTSTVNFRSYLESLLLPRIVLLAKGQAIVGVDEHLKPKSNVREEALRTLENWASPTFLNGALSKHTAFAAAYRDASLHTPSPPAPSTSSSPSNSSSGAATPKRRISLANGNGGRMHSNMRPNVANPVSSSAAATGATDVGASGALDAPKNDADFVKYYRERLVSFDTLHVVHGVKVTDKRIKRLRAFIEGHLDRLRQLAESAKCANEHRTLTSIVQYAQAKLRAFPDYKPPPNGTGLSNTSVLAPPPYPPPPAKRPGRRPSWDSISGYGIPAQPSQPTPPGHMGPQATPSSRPAPSMSGAQQRMLMALSQTIAATHPHMPLPHWSESHFTSLPVNLVNDPVRPQPNTSGGRIPSIGQPPPHQGIPPPHPSQQTATMHYQVPRPQPGLYPLAQHGMPGQHPHAHPYPYAQYPSSSLM